MKQRKCEYAPEKCRRDKCKSCRLWYKYKITVDDYNEMLVAQNGVCAICGRKETLKTEWLSVDHCHKTGRIRGLLCRACNYAIGLLGDDVTRLAKAIAYLTQSEER